MRTRDDMAEEITYLRNRCRTQDGRIAELTQAVEELEEEIRDLRTRETILTRALAELS